MRNCVTYNYWHDLKTDLRKPGSWLDFANMILRRFRLVLIKNVKDGETLSWRLRSWTAFLDEIHAQGNCNACRGDEAEITLLQDWLIYSRDYIVGEWWTIGPDDDPEMACPSARELQRLQKATEKVLHEKGEGK